jgi:serine/threonine protein kinase
MRIGGDKALKAAYRELILLKNNDHPNLLSLLDVFIPADETNPQDLSAIFLVMPKMTHTLFNFITTPEIPLYRESISKIINHILQGTAHLHKSGITHRVSIVLLCCRSILPFIGPDPLQYRH